MKRIIPFALAAGLILCGAAHAQTTLASAGSVWKYEATGTDLGTAWRTADYNDSAWPAGRAELGYGDAGEGRPEATLIPSSPVYPCYYFRQSFDVADPSAFGSLALRLLRDDGAVVYLNGFEIVRTNMPAGAIAFGTWASTAIGGADESAWNDFAVDPMYMITGTNILAVEVHQSSSTSTDVSFDLQLIGETPVPVVTLVEPADGSVSTVTAVTFQASATDATGLASATLYVAPAPYVVTLSGTAATDDAQISADNPNTNYGSTLSINVDGATPHAHAVIRFPNLIGSGPGQVPPGTAITSATLGVNCTNNSLTFLRFHRLLEDWVDTEVTWNQRAAGTAWGDAGADAPPSCDSTAFSADLTATGWRTIDLTAVVQAWCGESANHGIVIVDTGTDGADFDSSESGNPPVLTVQWGGGSLAAQETVPLSGTSATFAFAPIALADETEYLWNCLVFNSSGGSAWAPADFRVTVDTHMPSPPSLVAPADGATGVPMPASLVVGVSDPDGDTLDVTFYGRSASTAEAFTIIALPDTQKYSASYPDLFNAQTQWIANNTAALNIVFVTHEGDIVDTGTSDTQWSRANTAISVLDGVVPYAFAPGNHDEQDLARYNQTFPYTRYELEPWYGEHYGTANDDSYQLFSGGGMDFIAIHLDFGPSTEVIAWANGVLAAHPDRKAMITTHGYIDASGNRNVHVMGSTQYIWDTLVAPNPNVFFVLCGHVHGEYARTDTVGTRKVHQLLADYQDLTNGGNGYLRILRFVPAEDSVYVFTYSPYLDAYMTDANSEFALEFPMQGFRAIGADTGVASGGTASIDWSGLTAGTEYEWYAVATDPTGRSAASEAWSFTAAADTAPPVISDVAAVDVTETSARITWMTDEAADSLVDYGLDASYGTQAYDAARILTHSISLSGLSAGTTYHYRVSSTDAAENGSSSEDYTFTTPAPNYDAYVAAEPVVTFGTLNGNGIAGTTAAGDGLVQRITETANGAGGATSLRAVYTLHTAASQGAVTALTLYLTATWTNLDGGTKDALIVEIWNGGWQNITTDLLADGSFAPTSPTSYVDTSGNIYVRFSDTSAFRKEKKDTLTIDLLYAHVEAGPPDTTPPAAPTGLSGTASDVTVSLDWNDNGEADLAGYNLYRSLTPETGYVKLNSTPVTGSAYQDTGLAPLTTYYYYVTAVDGTGNESVAGGAVSVTTGAAPASVHVASIGMALVKAGKNWKAQASVRAVDERGTAVASATVTGNWTFKGAPLATGVTGVTGADGTTTIESPPVRAASGDTFTFTVTGVQAAGRTYDQAANAETQDSIAVP